MTRSRQTADWGSRAGLAKIVPSSVAVGSGSGSASALGTVTFTGASSVAIVGAFSSTYNNYEIKISLTAVTADAIGYIKLRSGATDASGTDYYYALNGLNNGGVGANVNGGAVSTGLRWTTIDGGTQGFYGSTIFLYNPFLTMPTTANILSNGVQQDATAFLFYSGGGNHTLGISYDGINIIASAGTMTGTVSVLGYN